MLKTICTSLFLLSVTLVSAAGQEHAVEPIAEPPEAEGVSAEITDLLADQGIRVKRSSTRTVCEIWFCKEVAVDPDFQPSEERLYPFTPGQLVGVLHFPRRGKEFRDQSISSGWYTLRFGLQPIDGNHEGTSPTRDFFLLVDAEQDEFADPWKVDDLNEGSSEAAGSSHPAMMCLQRASDGAELRIHHDEGNDWWVLHTTIQGVAKDKQIDIPLDLVVAGHANE